ncbi:CotH kinase family protein [Candidatus Latescibacterota bacterium]
MTDFPSLFITPREIDFGTVDFNSMHHEQFTLKNIQSDPITIDSITSDNEYFTVSPVSGVIAPGDSLIVTVTFSPDDISEQSAIITIQSGEKITTVYASGTGLGKILRETSLAEGENLYYRSIKIITWEYSLVDTITIEYSADGGETWDLVDSNIPVLNNKYFWRVPDVSSQECLLKLSDSADQSFFTISNIFVINNVITQSAGNKPVINEIMSSNTLTISDKDSEYTDWLEIFNPGNTPIDLTGYGLSDRPSNPYKWVFPDIVINPGQYLLVFASGKDLKDPETSYLHTNFKLNATGETLQLTDSSGNICDSVETGFILTDQSRGRQPDGSSNWVFFTEPTPCKSNTTEGKVFADSVEASLPSGFYDDSISLELGIDSQTATIYYTLDGNDPTDSSTPYSAPISLTHTTVVKARTYEQGKLPSAILINSYFINDRSTLTVISITTPPDNLWDPEIGIYTNGIYNNYSQDWERPINFELFEPDGTRGYAAGSGIKIHGSATRNFSVKSVALFARGKYGYNEFEYPFFPDLPFTDYGSIILRISGNDVEFTMFRDGFLQSLVEDLDLDIQEYRPAVVYYNGVYWGIHNIREKQNEEYLVAHHGVVPENIDVLEQPRGTDVLEVINGDTEHYDAMLEYTRTHDMSLQESYDYMKTQMQMDNYIDYLAFNIFIDNTDWPYTNIKFWRPRTSTGRWRWLVFDTERAFNWRREEPRTWYDAEGYRHDTIAMATAPNGPSFPNPPWSTYLIRKMFENPTFRDDFAVRLADLLNTIFQPDVVVKRINDMKSVIEPEMPRHIPRWAGPSWAIESMSDWQYHVGELINFAEHRNPYVFEHIATNCLLPNGTAELDLAVSTPGAGKIKVNTVILDTYPLTCTYFKDIPVRLTALPNPGYRFSGWQGIDAGDTLSTVVSLLTGDRTITANFVQDSGTSHSVVINEINYNSSSDFDTGDWVEFYNAGDSSIDMSYWIFRDDDDAHEFIIPENTVIEARGYIVLCRDDSMFAKLFPDVSYYIGSFGFGLANGGDSLRLFDSKGAIIDSLTYDNNAPWPVEPDGYGCTLSLRSPELDNSLPGNWATSVMHGTPGEKNENIVSVEEKNPPAELSLGQNYPNPFNLQTSIEFALPNESVINLSIFNITGQKVRELVSGTMAAGTHSVIWNGTSDSGQAVSSGVYISRITMGEKVAVRSMMLVK